MGVYIPDMDKPKSCSECELWSNCFYPKAPKEIDNKVMPDCPLIEIVQCKNCKWLGIDDGMTFCNIWLREVERYMFCNYGERETNERYNSCAK